MDQTEFDSRILAINSGLDDIIADDSRLPNGKLDVEARMRSGAKLYNDMKTLKNKIVADKDIATSEETVDRVDQIVAATQRLLVDVFNATPKEIEEGMKEYREGIAQP